MSELDFCVTYIEHISLWILETNLFPIQNSLWETSP